MHRWCAAVIGIYCAFAEAADRVLDDFSQHATIPPGYSVGSNAPADTLPSMALVEDTRRGRVLEVRGRFPCLNLVEPAVGAKPDEPDCAETHLQLTRLLAGPERAHFQGFGAWMQASAGIEFRFRIVRVVASPTGSALDVREYPVYRPASVRRPEDWFWAGVDVDAEPLQQYPESWSGAPVSGWHRVEWFALPSGAAQDVRFRLANPTLLVSRDLALATAEVEPLRPARHSLAERITLDIGFLNRNTDFARVDADLGRVRALGVNALRISQEWSATQQGVGSPLDWQPLDALRARLSNEPWRLLVILGLANPWYAQDCPLFGVFGGFPPVEGCPAYRQAWRAFVTAATSRLASHSGEVAYEVWNEPNLFPFWQPIPQPLEYASLARDTIPIVRAQHPRAAVLVGSLTHRQGSPKQRVDIGFLRRMQAPDVLAASEGFAWHPYRAGRTPPEQLSDDVLLLDETLRELGVAAPAIHDTEWGYTSVRFDADGNGHRAHARHAQAVYAARRWLTAAALGFEQIKWFNLRDGAHIEAPPGPDAAFDPERNFGLLTWAGEVKPAYRALQTLLGMLREHRLRGVLSTHRHDLVVQRWEAPGRLTWVAWYAAAARHDGQWPGGAPRVRVPSGARAWNLLGAELSPDAHGVLRLDATLGPVYIRDGGTDEVFWSGFER